MQTKKHINKIIILGLIVLFITLIVSYFYKKGLLPQSPIKLPLVIPTPAPVLSTYQSEKYKFSFSYPKDWQLTASDLEDVVQSANIPDNSILLQLTGTSDKGRFEVLVWKNLNKTPVTDWVRWYLHEEIDTEAVPEEFNYYFQGENAIQFVVESDVRKKLLQYIFINHNANVFEFIFEKSESAEKDFHQIKESFQFHDQETIPDNASKVIQLAKNNLSQKTGLPIDLIEVIEVVPMQWSDSSLGCPEEGKAYLEVITPGYRINLKAENTTFIYHTDLEKNVVLCPES